MRTIHKFPLAITDIQNIALPNQVKILCVQMQRGVPCLWVLLDPDEPYRMVAIIMRGTGHPIDDDDEVGDYIGTVQQEIVGLAASILVWHVFARL